MMTVSVQTTKMSNSGAMNDLGCTHLQLGIFDDQCPASYPQFAVLRDICPGQASERALVFRC